ncbi:MAG: mannonate dehydratase [Mangrovibacterium sp.]
MALEKTWRWFGEKDPVSLAELRQMDVEGVVTALHHIPNGEVWTVEEILKVRRQIEQHGMRWSVVESLPVSEGIKTHNKDYDRLVGNYRESLRNLGRCNIDRVCYNFMPVLDWVRTDLHYRLPNGGEVMLFDFPTFVAFDLFILKRPGAEDDYPAPLVEKAARLAAGMSEEKQEQLARNIIVVTQGFIDGVIEGKGSGYKKLFMRFIDMYRDIDANRLRRHLSCFLKDVVPVAEACGVKLCIHADDPPFRVLGLPRVVSTQEDLEWICNQVDSVANGITFCSGSLSVNRDNDLVAIVRKLGPRIHFTHLRNNIFLEDGSFHESGHLHGDVDIFSVMKALLEEQQRRRQEGRTDCRIPVRPDHGIKMLSDFSASANPGYPLVGRLRGLAELRGLETGVERILAFQQR